MRCEKLLKPDVLLKSYQKLYNCNLKKDDFYSIQVYRENLISRFFEHPDLVENDLFSKEIKTLFIDFPLRLRAWLFILFITFVFEQFVKKKTAYYNSYCSIYISPLIQCLYNDLRSSDSESFVLYKEYSDGVLYKKLSSLQNIIKKNENSQLKKDYLRKRDSLKKAISRLKGKKKDQYIRELIIEIVMSLNKCGFRLDKIYSSLLIKGSSVKTINYIINLSYEERLNIIRLYAFFCKQPMICKPKK